MSQATDQNISILSDIGKLIDIDMDKRTIAVLIDLIEFGVHPEALSDGYIIL